MWNIVSHIAANIRYFECTYNKSPERIFISTLLLRELESELAVVHYHKDGDYMTCCGVLVEEFYSDKREYYLAESGFKIEI